MVPSTFTTTGPRWSSLTVVLPLLMSSWVVELCGASGRASGVLWDDSGVAEVFADSLVGFETEFEEVLMLRERGIRSVRER